MTAHPSNVCTFAVGSVTLIDGRAVPLDSEEWRAECEARGVLKLYSKQARLAYLQGVATKRGEASKTQLYRDVMRVYEHERSTRGIQ